ncbi:MAG: minor capsid protein, partial [Evtepia gabavorous]
MNSVNTQLTQMVIRGEAPDRAISAISKQFDVSRAKAGRLVMTESAYFSSAGQKDCYKALDVERYKIVASFDKDTCSLCADMDGKVFKMSEYQVGLTAPPFHPWCRCCTC